MEKLYWVSFIIQNQNGEPYLCTLYNGIFGIDNAKEEIEFKKKYHNVLSAWIDTFDENNNKITVFHECYINIFGDIER